ncbi:FAD-dependent oxidoreductase [Gordonia polyisoprenivorans]|uniref:FAD-dependent oxidoreductase n=1 Tax=Gordonia polyisoprenivorans TaxID=84595 RepID=UPI0023007C70|nr:FAD-dependent oxidoreductase [Gordonia polyisoprenivorans]WCB38273.1 FAD-dependent oxidoreductase [Gordonia polyisoprenivorans]
MTHVAVIGAGPAGLAAAESALHADATVTLVDLNDAPGGQYHRELPAAYRAARPDVVGHEWDAYRRRRGHVLGHPACTWMSNTVVFLLERRGAGPRSGRDAPRLHLLTGGVDAPDRTRAVLEPDALILATGAHDRVLPFPGWTLPGVYTAGAAQTLARTERVALGRRAVISGTGPFLLPVAESLSSVGTEVTEVLEANGIGTIARGWSAQPQRLLAQTGKARDLMHYGRHLLAHRIPVRGGQAVIRALGDSRVQGAVIARLDADWTPIPGTEREIEVDTICVGHGFTPSLELATAAGCAAVEVAGGTFVGVDDNQLTSAPAVYAAGEVTGIGGAASAHAEGVVAGYAAAGRADLITARMSRARVAAQHFSTRLATAHPIGDGWQTWLEDTTVVCRCEATTLGQLRGAHSAEESARATRLNTRAGLGPCQARFCGANVDAICGRRAADRTGASGLPAATPQNRPIAQPIRLGELAGHDGR